MLTGLLWALLGTLAVVNVHCHLMVMSNDFIPPQAVVNQRIAAAEKLVINDNDVTETINDDSCSGIPNERRLDCYPEQGANEDGCLNRGCCWNPPTTDDVSTSTPHPPNGDNVPYCFYSTSYQQTGYKMDKLEIVNATYRQVLATRGTPSHMPQDVMNIKIEASYQTNSRLRVKIYDPHNERWEVPQKFVERPVDHVYAEGVNPQYSVDMDAEGGFKLQVSRAADSGSLIMNALVDNFIFADQFLQVSFDVNGAALYGLGEHRGPLMYSLGDWKRVGIFARDQPPGEGINLYGSHPMYIMIEEGGTAHAVVLMNSNAMDVTIQPSPIITWRTIGGILDFYVLTGPTPNDVITQYFDLIGRPHLPPYWAFGFHLCRWGYGSAEETWEVVKRTRLINFPQEVQWNDIDYMDQFQDFTFDNVTYHQLPALVQDLHDHKQKYMMILDPGISDRFGSDAWKQGTEMDIWIKNATGKPLEGSVWPGPVNYPDFTHHKIDDYWYGQLKAYHDQIPFDGIWIDMNEVSDFVVGSTTGCTSSTLDNPPYTPDILDHSLQVKTICPSALQEAGTHYNLHNLYGHTEGISSRNGLDKLYSNRRSPIISRSTFMGSGRIMGHWTGDNQATWDDIKYSIAGVVNTNMFGISFTGADICGFIGNTTGELCTRWMQLGSFYTFMRNHNTEGAADQDPAMFPENQRDIMKKYTLMRYRYLPYLYTQMFKATSEGQMVLKSLAFEFPYDPNTYSIDTQFLWGPSFMVAPVLTSNTDVIDVYFPKQSSWYTAEHPAEPLSGGITRTVNAPLDYMPIYARAGSIVVSQRPELYLDDARKNDFTIEIFMSNDDSEHKGHLFWDDGSQDLALEQFTYVEFTFKRTPGYPGWVLVSDVQVNNYKDLPKLSKIEVYGLEQKVTLIEDEKRRHIDFVSSEKPSRVYLHNINFDLTQNFNIFLRADEPMVMDDEAGDDL